MVALWSGGSTAGDRRRTLLEAKARDDRYDFRRPHLGLPAAGGGHFRLGQFLGAHALLQGMEHDPEVGIGQNPGDAGKGGKR